MDGYRQRTIAELLKKTYKLNRPRMTPILEGKHRMQGPLDITDAEMDFASLQVCGNCRNHLDATVAQNCGMCNKGYHSFCLEATPSASEDPSLQCCYYCQHQAAPDSHQPGPSSEDARNKVSEDGGDVCRAIENAQDCDEPGTSYDASEHSPVTKRMDLAWNEASPSKQNADSEGTVLDSLCKPTKTRAARKLGIRRKRITDGTGHDSSSSQALPSDTDASRSALESSGVDALQNASQVLLEGGDVMSTSPEAGIEEIKEGDSGASSAADFQITNLKMKIDPGEASDDQQLEACVISSNKDAEIVMGEVATGNELIKEENVKGAEKMIGSLKLDVAIMAQPVPADILPPDHFTDCFNKVLATSEAPSLEIREEIGAVGPLFSRDSAKEGHPPNETGDAVKPMVAEHDLVSESQVLIGKQPDFVKLPKVDDDAHRVSAGLVSNTLCEGPQLNTMGEGTLLPIAHITPAVEVAKINSSSLVLEGPDGDDKVKPLIFVEMKGILPSIQEETNEHHSDGLSDKAAHKEEIQPKEYSNLKDHMDIDSVFTGSETTHGATLDSPNDRGAMEDDIKVCDICGDAGYEDMLAICSECNGAEHVYCYQNLTAQVPEGYWQCDRCRSKQKAGDFRPSNDIRSVNALPTRLPSFNSTRKHGSVGNSRSRLSALLQKRRLPSEKKRGMKGAPSSQFPAKRGIVENAADAPPAKKQAVEAASTLYMPSAKLGLSREASFKIPDTGKVKFVSHTALMGTNGEGTGLSSSGNSKLPLSLGSPSTNPLISTAVQSGQTSKGRFSSASNSVVGTGSVKVNTTSQLSAPSSSAPLVISGLKTSGSLKSSESTPSFLLPSKSMGPKLQLSSKGLKEATDSTCPQGLPKEGFPSQAGIANARALSKTSSFKLSKVIGSGGPIDPRLKNDINLESAKSSGSKFLHPEVVGLVKAAESKHASFNGLAESRSKAVAPTESSGSKFLHPEVGLVKAAESKQEVGSFSGLAENRSKAAASSESRLPLETHNGVYNCNKLIKHEVGASLQVTNPCLKDETVVVASCRSEAQQSSVLSSSVKEAQDLSIEQDKKFAFQVTSPNSLARQTLKLPEQVGLGTSKEVSKTSVDDVQWAGLLPCPVIVVQEYSTCKAEENKALQLAVSVDAVGEKNTSAVIDKAPTHDDNRSSFTPRSRSFGAWNSPSYVPSLGSTRCYRCKELGHSAKNCNNRSSMPCISPEGAGAFKAVLPATNVDSTSVQKGVVPAYSMDNTARTVQSVVEVVPKIKPTTEMAPILKPLSTERVLVSVQNPTSTVGELQAQMQEGQVLEHVVPLASPVPNPLVDQQMRKDTVAYKQIIADSVPSPTQVNIGSADHTEDTTEISAGKKEDYNTPVRPMNPANVSIPSGTQLTTASAEYHTTKSAAHLSAALGPLSGANVKVTTPFVSRYQESLKVYPEAQIVWQGTFEVAGRAKPQVSFHGLQANPSNRALPKVREVAKKLHPLLPLEELPRGSEHNSWPIQFQKSPPINDNIALYFFASGKESYMQYYKPLVDRLIKFDLTLKGSIEDAEVLIFPSNLLPPGSQCWNNFMFLWAVFRARKVPIKPPNVHYEAKQSGSDGGFKLPQLSGVLTGRGEDMQIDTIGNKNIAGLHVAGNKTETPSSTIAEGVNSVGPSILSDSDVVVCEQQQPCQQELQHLMQVEAVVTETIEQKGLIEPMSSQSEKAVAMLLPSLEDSIVAVVKSEPMGHPLPPVEGGPGLDASNEISQLSNSSIKLEEKFDTSKKLLVPSAAKSSSLLLRSEQGSTEKAKHSTPLMVTSPALVVTSPALVVTSPALVVCPSPRDRQEDLWTTRKPSSHSPAGQPDKDKGVRDRIIEKSDRVETGRGVSRDRDREKQRDREKHKERDRDRDRSRRHSDWEREKERERGKERERDRDRDRDRDRGRDKERDRERWRDREERDRRGRDWDRDRDKVGERDKGRERGREREAERERALPRDRSSRHRHWDPSEGEYGRSGRHWHRYPRSRTPSRSPPANRDWSPSRPRPDRYHHRYHRSSRHSRSYSHSPDSDTGLGHLQARAESRELSKDSFARKGKSPDIVVGDSMAKQESAVKTSAVKDSGGDEQGNYSQRGSNSNSLCREKTAGMERKLPIADLNLSPSEIEGNDEEGNEDDVTMSVEVAMPLNANQDDHTSGCHDFFPPNEEPGECSMSVGKVVNNRSTEHLICVDERTESLSHSLMNDSSGPSLFPLSMSLEGSSSCLQFFPQATDDDNRLLNTPDLNLALGAKEQSLPQQGELPLVMQLLEPCQEISRLGTANSALDVPMVLETTDLSLSLAIPEHSKRPVVNTSLRLFG